MCAAARCECVARSVERPAWPSPHSVGRYHIFANFVVAQIECTRELCCLFLFGLSEFRFAVPEGFPVEEDYGEPFYYGRQACAELLRVLGSGTAGV